MKEEENEQEYYRRVIKEYEKEKGPLPPQRAPSLVRNWAMKHEEFRNNVPRHSQLKAILAITDDLLIEDIRDILDETDFSSIEDAKKFLHWKLEAAGSEVLKQRIDMIVTEINRQRVECFRESF